MRQIGANKLVDQPSMHHLGPALLQRPLNVDLSKRCRDLEPMQPAVFPY